MDWIVAIGALVLVIGSFYLLIRGPIPKSSPHETETAKDRTNWVGFN